MSLVHLHLMLNHIPVVGTLFLIALFGYAVLRRDATVSRVALWTAGALAVVALVVYLTGEPAEELVEDLAGTSEAAIEEHEEMALAATVAMGITGAAALLALFAVRRRAAVPRWVPATGLVASLAVGAVMAVTANLGGQIRHSEIRSGATTAAAGEAAREAGKREHDER